MTIVPEPSTSRGDITLQPSYFTSSLYVEPLREDLRTLTDLFSEQYEAVERPFELFKKLWTEQGWCWLHLRVYDGRGRQMFLRITERVFIGTLVYAASSRLVLTVLLQNASQLPSPLLTEWSLYSRCTRFITANHLLLLRRYLCRPTSPYQSVRVVVFGGKVAERTHCIRRYL